MGSKYSLNGFINAALRRTSKTVLVEGSTDKDALHRIELERFPANAGISAIDEVGILDDPSLAKIGNKAKVLAVQAVADQLAVAVPKISMVLATLTDREWDGITFLSCVPHPSWTPPTQQANRFITQGHSLENYCFNLEYITAFLKFRFPRYVSVALLARLQDQFSAILVFATVLSLKIRDKSCIQRCSGLIKISHVDLRNNRIYLDASFGSACADRNIPVSESIVEDTNDAIDLAWTHLDGKDFTQWLPHGHIGEEIIWSAVAKIALDTNVDSTVASDIIRAHKSDRGKFKAEWLSKIETARRAPLDDTIEWLQS